MWVKREEYLKLVASEARAQVRADWLLNRVNQVERELGALRFKVTGEPQVVPVYHKEATPKVDADDEMGTASHEDMGDDVARKLGVGWDDSGRVTYENR